MTQTLEGKVALVTGAGRGLGRSCAIMMASRGARIVVATQTTQNGEERRVPELAVQLPLEANANPIFEATRLRAAKIASFHD